MSKIRNSREYLFQDKSRTKIFNPEFLFRHNFIMSLGTIYKNMKPDFPCLKINWAIKACLLAFL